MEIEEHKGYTIEIREDSSDIHNPRSWGNLGKMICFHSKYNLGDKHNYSDPDKFQEFIKEEDDNIAIILPLFIYEHSGITINVSRFNCPWDSGQVGWIYITREKIREEYSVKRISRKLIDKIIEYLIKEVENYAKYLEGQVYGFTIIDENDEPIDSCSGYYGHNHKESGLLDAAQGTIDHYIRQIKEEREKKNQI